MRGEVDLHIHSDRSSDGDFSPFHLIRLAKKKKFRALSISDHDTVAAYPEALEWGAKEGIEVIPSIEVTTLFDDREFHLLIPFINWKKKIIPKIISKIGKKRIEEAQDRVRKLQNIGFDISWKEITRETGSSPPLGVSIAQILIEKGERTGDPSLNKYYEKQNRLLAPYLFYRDYFMEGKPASVQKRNVSLVEILEIIPKTGGVPVLAHPGAYFQQVKEKDIRYLKERGLEGLEVYTTYHEPEQTKLYKELADRYDLVPTAGSDFHGKIKPHIPFGAIKDGDYSMVEALRERRK